MTFWVMNFGNTPIAKAICNIDDPAEEEHLKQLGYTRITQEDFDSISIPNQPKRVTLLDLEKENKLLRAQIQAQTERSDFIEDCIAEMATQVYGGV